MITTTKKINLAQLDKELNAGGLSASTLGNETEITPVNEKITDEQLQAAVDKHLAIDDAEAAATQKAALLARLGITADEAKLLIG